MKKQMLNKKGSGGITLIALVITIVVLLILAGVSIAMLTGENGILTQAQNAKTATEKAEAKERIQLEVLGSYGTNGELDINELKSNLTKNVPGVTVGSETDFPLTVTVDGYTFTIDANGNVELSGPQSEVTEAKIVVNSDGTGEVDSVLDNSQTEGTKLYISFKASIEGGTIKSVTSNTGTPILTNETYVTEITKNGTYTFTIIGTVDGEDYETTYTMEVKKYALRAGLKVGDYINYEPDQGTEENPIVYSKDKLTSAITGSTGNTADITQNKLNWQILKIYEDGSMDVIGSLTSKTIYFQGAEGYNNGVYVMDDICKTLYSRGDIKARSVDLEDFEKNLTDAGKAAKANYISNKVKALTTGTYITNVNTENNTVTYVTGRSYYPNIYAEENGSGIDTTEVKTNGIKDIDTLKDAEGNPAYDTNSGTSAYKQADSNLTVTYTRYDISINNTNYGDAYKALNNNTNYWLASRCVYCDSDYALFGLHFAGPGNCGDSMYYSRNGAPGSSLRLRPVIHLGSEVQIEACTGTNSKTNMHIITQY